MARVTSREILTTIVETEEVNGEAWEALAKVVQAELAFEDAQAQREMLERHSECGKTQAAPVLTGGGYH
jgi:hypothetical protein